MERNDTPKQISIDNGFSFSDPADLWDEITERGLWDAIVDLMDDDTRDYVHSFGDYTDNDDLSFLAEYLYYADNDLIVG